MRNATPVIDGAKHSFAGRIGAALCVPREAFHVVWQELGDDLSELSRGASAFELAGSAGLRASEVRGLPSSDVDLKVGIITVRRGLTLGVEVMPKSHHQRLIPIGQRLRTNGAFSRPVRRRFDHKY